MFSSESVTFWTLLNHILILRILICLLNFVVLILSINLYYVLKFNVMKLNPAKLILTASSLKQLSMICKINVPFKLVQVVFKKGVKQSFVSSFRDKCDESGSTLIYINREYDGSERYALLYPSGYSVDFFPQDSMLVVLS